MNELRAMVVGGERAALLAARAPRNKAQGDEPSLAGFAIPRQETRSCNQRREDRHLNVVESAELRFRGRKLEVQVINVSRHGAMIEAAIDARIGERLQISFEGCNRTDCCVRWVRKGRIGLEFARETEILASAAVREKIVSGRREGETPPPPDAADPAEKQERAPRQSLLWKAVLHWDHGTFAVRIRNISAEGAMLEGREELPAGTGIVLDLGMGGTASGLVRWARGGQLGVRFDSRFDMRRLVVPDRSEEDSSPSVLKPHYLESELASDSPWAAAWDRLSPDDLDAPE
jgi:hypothetical protein